MKVVLYNRRDKFPKRYEKAKGGRCYSFTLADGEGVSVDEETSKKTKHIYERYHGMLYTLAAVRIAKERPCHPGSLL